MIGIVLGAYALMVVVWLFYLASMHLVRYRSELGPVAKAHGYLIVGVGLVLDAVLNLAVATVLFLEPPRELLLTARLKRLVGRDLGWRGDLAAWVCERLLNQFDPSGGHCD